MNWGFLLELLGALPELLKLLGSICTSVDQAEQQGIGRQLALSQALLIQSAAIDDANRIKADAISKHNANPTDDAFDKDFKRP